MMVCVLHETVTY